MSFDEWTPSPPQPPTPPIPGLPPANSWNPAPGCSTPPTSPSIAAGVIITGVPAQVGAMFGGQYVWSITLNDGSSPANFTIDRYDASGVLIDHPLELSGVNGAATFNDPVFMPAATAASLQITTGNLSIPNVFQLAIPGGPIGAYIGSASPSGMLAWFNLPPPVIPTDAPTDGQIYARQNAAWTPITEQGGQYLPLVGGTMSGNIQMAGTNANRWISGNTGSAFRWAVQFGDNAAETGSNNGSNFSISNFSDAGTMLGTPFTINRATGQTTIANSLSGNSPALSITKPNGGVSSLAGQTAAGAMRWQAYLADYNAELGGNLGSNFRIVRYDDSGTLIDSPLVIARSSGQMTLSVMPSFPGGIPGQTLTTTDGAGTLAWATIPPSGIPDAPNDGQQYARQSLAWSPVAMPPPYVLPPATTATLGGVKPDGTSIEAASDGTISTVLIPMGDNRIINGDMRIDQRNDGAEFTPPASGYYTIDRWVYFSTQNGQFSCGRNIGPPGSFAPGFPYCLGFNSLAFYIPLTTDTFGFYQMIEADMVSDLQWGTANAQPVTLSFWVLAYPLTGVFSGSIRNEAATRSYPFSFSIPVANNWTQVSLTIPGDTAGSWVMSGNGGALNVAFELGGSTTFRGPAGAWTDGNLVGANGAVSVCETGGASFYVTGVKLEIGTVATPFNRQSLAKSLADCQRYYQVGQWQEAGYGFVGIANVFTQNLLIPMRVTPTVAYDVSFGLVNISTAAPNPLSPSTLQINCVVAAEGGYITGGNYFASAEL